MLTDDLLAFADHTHWAEIKKRGVRLVGSSPPGALSFEAEFVERFPQLAALLKKARVTDFHVLPARTVGRRARPSHFPNDHVVYRLWAWTTHTGQFAGWCASPISSILTPAVSEMSADHLLILRHAGAINWAGTASPGGLANDNHNSALNQNFVFGFESAHDVKLWVKEYRYNIDHPSPEYQIEPRVDFDDPRWVCFAQECNGNELLYDRDDDDRVLLVAGDHAFNFVRPSSHYRWRYQSRNYRSDTLLEIKGVTSLRDWTEKFASQWLAHVV